MLALARQRQRGFNFAYVSLVLFQRNELCFKLDQLPLAFDYLAFQSSKLVRNVLFVHQGSPLHSQKRPRSYFKRMRENAFRPCIPARRTKVPHRAEVKQDGNRLIVQRDGDRVRLSRATVTPERAANPLIVEAARRISTKQFVLECDAVLLGVDRF